MKAIIKGEEHNVIFIDYHDDLPHTVVTEFYVSGATEIYWRKVFWDFFPDKGMKDDLLFYRAGSGGNHQLPKYVDGYLGKYWVSDVINGPNIEGEAKNAIKLKSPIQLACLWEPTPNPFTAGQYTDNYEYCDVCKHGSDETCWQHKFEDEEDDYRLKYKPEFDEFNQ